MDPRTYCRAALTSLRHREDSPGAEHARIQCQITLAYFQQRTLAPDEFEAELQALIRRSKRAGRGSLARAARDILDNWTALAHGRSETA